VKILLSKQAGGPETLILEEVPDPVPGAGEVLIGMRACGVNFPDALIIADQYQLKPPRPFAPGAELAGVVEAIGPEVQELRIGDRVLAVPGWGGMAEKLVVKASGCTLLPSEMSFEQAATLVATYGTVFYAFHGRTEIREGESVLVLGAGGGVGLAAVELGRAAGARVIAAASTQEKVDLALSRGAQTGFVYPTGAAAEEPRALAQLFKQHCGAQGVDVVCDITGGVYAEAALRAMAWGGRYLVIGFTAGIPRIPLNLPLLKGCAIIGVIYGGFAHRDPAGARAQIQSLFALHRTGAIAPYVSARYALADGGLAIAALQARRALGKLVVVAGA
jgi:NADPH2:quinone reductase